MGHGAGKQRLLRALGQFDGPLQPTGQCSAREVGAANIGRTEAALALEKPGLGMQTGAPAIERHAHFAPRQACQLVQRTRLGRAGVGGGEDAQAGLAWRLPCWLRAHGRDLLQHVLQLAHAGDGDEADQNVHLVAGCQLTADFLQQRRRAFSGGKEPGHPQTNLRRRRELLVTLDRPQDPQRRGNQVNHIRGWTSAHLTNTTHEPLPQHHQKPVDQLQLRFNFVRILAGQVVEECPKLPRNGIG